MKKDWFKKLAEKHGIFVLQEHDAIDFFCITTGKNIGIWRAKHQPHFIINGIAHNGTPKQALEAIIAPYDLGG